MKAITDRQRLVQAEKFNAAIELLKLAILETETATPDEIAGTIETVLEIVTKSHEFLTSRPSESNPT